jgi:hypothetical protein
MSRVLRTQHQQAVAMIGLNSHRELRRAFDDSAYRKAWLIDGKLASIGGVTGPAISAYGFIWLAFSDEATKYPLAIVKLMRAQIAEVMQTRRLLVATVLDGDEASDRLAIFLGFVPYSHSEYVLPASSKFGRLEVARHLREREEARIRIGTGYGRVLAYHHLGAD